MKFCNSVPNVLAKRSILDVFSWLFVVIEIILFHLGTISGKYSKVNMNDAELAAASSASRGYENKYDDNRKYLTYFYLLQTRYKGRRGWPMKMYTLHYTTFQMSALTLLLWLNEVSETTGIIYMMYFILSINHVIKIMDRTGWLYFLQWFP